MHSQRWNPATYGRHARFVPDSGWPAVECLDPSTGKRGLGDRIADAQYLAFDEEFDAPFVSAGLHWTTNAQGVADGVWRAHRPRGRFVAEFGVLGNVRSLVDALERESTERGIDGRAANARYFPSTEEHAELLRNRGIRIRDIYDFERGTKSPGDFGGRFEAFAGAFVHSLPKSQLGADVTEVTDTARTVVLRPDWRWIVDYGRRRVRAIKNSFFGKKALIPDASPHGSVNRSIETVLRRRTHPRTDRISMSTATGQTVTLSQFERKASPVAKVLRSSKTHKGVKFANLHLHDSPCRYARFGVSVIGARHVALNSEISKGIDEVKDGVVRSVGRLVSRDNGVGVFEQENAWFCCAALRPAGFHNARGVDGKNAFKITAESRHRVDPRA